MATKSKLSVISEYAGIAKILATIVISIVTGVWGVAMFYNRMENKKAADKTMVMETHIMVKEMKVQVDSIMVWMREFDGQLNAVHENTVLIGNYVEAVHAGIKEDLRTRKDAEFQHYIKITSIIEDGLKKKEQQDSLESEQQLDSMNFKIKVRKLTK